MGSIKCLDIQVIIKNYASVINRTRLLVMLTQRVGLATYVLVRASSNKLQAASVKLQAPSSSKKEPQASSVKHKGSSAKPQASSSWIIDPGKSFTDL